MPPGAFDPEEWRVPADGPSIPRIRGDANAASYSRAAKTVRLADGADRIKVSLDSDADLLLFARSFVTVSRQPMQKRGLL